MDFNNKWFCWCVRVGDDSISVINENQATGETAREKDTVGVTLKAPKGKSVVYKALALNVHFMSKLLCQTNTASY